MTVLVHEPFKRLWLVLVLTEGFILLNVLLSLLKQLFIWLEKSAFVFLFNIKTARFICNMDISLPLDDEATYSKPEFNNVKIRFKSNRTEFLGWAVVLHIPEPKL